MALKRIFRLLMAMVLVSASNLVLAELSCGNNTNSGNARCKQIASSNGYPDGRWNIQSKAGYPSTSMSCMGSTTSGAKYELGWFSCTGSCTNGVVPTISNGYSCDVPPDDCSADLATMGADLSGSVTDGSCGCPADKDMIGSGSSAVRCAQKCLVDEIRNSEGVCTPKVICQGNLTLVNGTCGCRAGQVQGTFNGVPTCAPTATTNPVAPMAGVTQGGGTIVSSTGQTSTTTPNGDGTYTTNTTINNNTVINGVAAGSGSGAGVSGAGTATISSGTTTMSVVTDSTGKVISSTSTGTEQKSNDSLTLPSVEPAHAPLDTTGISGAIMNSPIVSAFTSAFGRFPTVGGCSTIVIPLFKGMVVEFKEQCRSFETIRQYLTMFAMVVYGLLSYRIFMRSASGV